MHCAKYTKIYIKFREKFYINFQTNFAKKLDLYRKMRYNRQRCDKAYDETGGCRL